MQRDKNTSFSESDAPFFRALIFFAQGGRSDEVGVIDQRKNIKGALRFFDNVDTEDGLFRLARTQD